MFYPPTEMNKKDRKIEIRNPEKVDQKRERDRIMGNGEGRKGFLMSCLILLTAP
jgi:hypothetical protein